DRNRSHWSTSKTPSYTKSVSWHHYPKRYGCIWKKFPYDSVKDSVHIKILFIELILNDYTSVLSVGQYRIKLKKAKTKQLDIINTTVFSP
ncbi:hypothetical protein QP249_13505, partial [Klebsiella pneumoniae]